jgi:putative protein kinase ArgK-like GTPase of G3E family
MLALADRDQEAWKPPIVQTVAQTGQGVDEVVEKIDEHRAWLTESGELARRRVRRARDEIEAIAVTDLRKRWGDVHARTELDELAERVAAGKSDPYAAAAPGTRSRRSRPPRCGPGSRTCTATPGWTSSRRRSRTGALTRIRRPTN